MNRQIQAHPKRLRDRVFLILLYDTGSRIQEILDIILCDLQFGRLLKVTLFGKEIKTCIVPLMEISVKHLQKYLSLFHAAADLVTNSPLFYSITRGEKYPLTSQMTQYIFQKYGERARLICQEVPEKVYPHLFRHNRVMHLYQERTELTFVSQWLIYSHLETIQIYAHADTEHKRKAIAAATPQDNLLHSS